MFGKIALPQQVNKPADNKSKKPLFTNPQTNRLGSREGAFKAFEDLKNKEFSRIYNHERQHQQAGGQQAGSINMEYDGNGVAIGGHVAIQVPSTVNKQSPDITQQKAETAYNAAMAVGDPSAADLMVASLAQGIRNLAMQAVSDKKLPTFKSSMDPAFKAQENRNNKEVTGNNFDMLG